MSELRAHSIQTTVQSDCLLAHIEALPAQRSNSALVLRICDDPNAGAQELGAAVLTDVVLTTKLLQLANSAHFGLSREIRDPASAIGALGFGTVRALAMVQLAGAMDTDTAVPKEFWAHSARAGAACSLLASHFQVRSGEAFALGLLHDIGKAVLADLGIEFSSWDDQLDEPAEDQLMGLDHADVGRRLCDLMELPEFFGDVIGRHHDDVDEHDDPRRRLLATALCLMGPDVDEAVACARAAGVDEDFARHAALALDSHAVHLIAVLR